MIVIEVARTIIVDLSGYVRRAGRQTAAPRIRLGQSMVKGLEFQVAADILKTALAPTLDVILLPAALIALRTAPNYPLQAAPEKLDARRALAPGDGDQPGR